MYISDSKASELINRDQEIKKHLTELFGNNIYQPDGLLNKKRLAEIIFNDKEAIKQVNGIVHPAVTRDFTTWCSTQRSPLLFFESAILFEAKLENLFDYIILITADIETRVERVISRDATTREKVIEQSKSDFVIYNNNDDKVIRQILSIIHQLNNIHSKQT